MNINLSALGIEETIKAMMALPNKFRAARNSALTYAGAAYLKEVRDSARSNALGWPGLNPITRWLAKHKPLKGAQSLRMTKSRLLAMWADLYASTSKGLKYRQPWGRLIGVIAFQLLGKDSPEASLKLGVIPGFRKGKDVISSTCAYQAKQLTNGFVKPVTPEMRRYLAAVGVPVRKSKTQMQTPARPLIVPVWERFRNRFVELFQSKYLQKVFNGYTGSVRSLNRDAA